jgi:hypothetical protein
MTYEEALRRLGGRPSRKVGHETHLHLNADGSVAVRYHATGVVTIHADGTYTLNSGGYKTVTTKRKINEFAPVRLSQEKGEWFLYLIRIGGTVRVPFDDGVRVGPKGIVGCMSNFSM